MQRALLRHGLLGGTLIAGAAGAIGSIHTGDLPGNGDSWGLALAFGGFGLLGWLVCGRRPRLALGWLMLIGGAVGSVAFLASWWATETLSRRRGSLPGGAVAAWIAVWTSPLSWLLVLAAPIVLFPDGKPRTRRWAWFVRCTVGVVASMLTAAAVIAVPVAVHRAAELLDQHSDTIHASRPAHVAISLQAVARLIAFVSTIAGLIGIVVVRRRATRPFRQQCSTVLVGVAAVVAVFLIDGLVPAVFGQQHRLPEAVGAIATLALPAAITVAVLRFQLYELRSALNRSLLLAFSGTLLAAVYLGALLLIAAVIGVHHPVTVPSLIAAGVVVAISAPAVAAARRMNRRWFGRGRAPAAMATRFAEQVVVADGPRTTLELLAASMRDELRLGWIALRGEGLDEVSLGEPSGPVTRVGLRYDSRSVGELRVTARPGEALGTTDRRTLKEIAGYVSIAVEATRVNADLRNAQRAIEAAHAEERRRVRRDLHDDVGPTLASARLRVAAMRRHLADGRVVDPVLDQLAEALRAIRRVVDGLQPSVLEDVGLVPALQILLTDIGQTSGTHFALDAPTIMPELSMVAASTAYRVVAEALANVVRHSGAATCRVHIVHTDGMLHIEVIDDGRGFETGAEVGMGMRSMSERATMAHGEMNVDSSSASGTRIALQVPT